MTQWIEVKATYEKMMENGTQKRVTEPYLIDALSVTEAEARAIEELTPYVSGELSVKACKVTPIAEVFNLDADRYYLVKVGFISVNDKTGQEKRTITQMLVGASDFDEAVGNFKEGMKGTISDYELTSLSETGYADVYATK